MFPQLLRLQGDAVRAGLAAYGRQLVGGQGSEYNSDHEVAEANKELQTIMEVRDRIAAELRHIADLLEEQPPLRAASISGQVRMQFMNVQYIDYVLVIKIFHTKHYH